MAGKAVVEVHEARPRLHRRDLGYQVPKQVLLSWLAEREPIDREGTPEPVESLEITAQGQGRNVSFNLRTAGDRINPIRHEIGCPSKSALLPSHEEFLPRVCSYRVPLTWI